MIKMLQDGKLFIIDAVHKSSIMKFLFKWKLLNKQF